MDWVYYTAAGDVMAEQQAELTDDEHSCRGHCVIIPTHSPHSDGWTFSHADGEALLWYWNPVVTGFLNVVTTLFSPRTD